MIRLFAAVSVPEWVGEALDVDRSTLPGASWRAAESLHITLRFFGDVSETTAADLDGGFAGLSASAFDLDLAGVGAFGGRDYLRAVWAGISPSEPLDRLAKRCESIARRCGLPPETRNYRPHATLAYLKHTPEPQAAAWVQRHSLLRSPSWRVSGFGLYSSWRSSAGSRYDLERDYRLA